MKILVTGGAGFIGSHLIDRLLKDGHHVTCVDDLSLGKKENFTHNLGNSEFKFIKSDLSVIDNVREIFKEHNFDCVFHMAANSDIQASSKDRTIDLKRTFLTTFNVLDCLAEFNVKQLVFASSSTIYGDTGELKVKEDHGPAEPISFYGAAKLSSEAFISTYSYHFDIDSLIFRFPNVVGGRATHGVIYDFINISVTLQI